MCCKSDETHLLITFTRLRSNLFSPKSSRKLMHSLCMMIIVYVLVFVWLSLTSHQKNLVFSNFILKKKELRHEMMELLTFYLSFAFVNRNPVNPLHSHGNWNVNEWNRLKLWLRCIYLSILLDSSSLHSFNWWNNISCASSCSISTPVFLFNIQLM